MKSTLLLASIATLAAITGVSSHAHEGRDARAHATPKPHTRGMDHGMQAVPTTAGPGEPGHGWRYFSDPAAGSAVVISPQGEYFHSRGKGLRLVAVTQPGS